MISFESILEQIRAYNPQVDVELLTRANQCAARAHQGQQAPGGADYLQHALEVASILARLKVDETALVVGLLHDVLQAGTISGEELSAEFGAEVLSLVEVGQKISSIPYRKSNQQQVESFRKMFVSMARDLRVILVYLADRLSDMRTLDYREQQERTDYANQ